MNIQDLFVQVLFGTGSEISISRGSVIGIEGFHDTSNDIRSSADNIG